MADAHHSDLPARGAPSLPDAAALVAALARSGLSLCLVDPGDRIVAASDAWLAATGFTRAEVLGRNVLTLFPDTAELGRALHARARREGTVAVPRHRQDVRGVETWWDGEVTAVVYPDGLGILIVARDVTIEVQRARLAESLHDETAAHETARVARREAEETARALAETSAVLDAIVEHAPIGIGLWDTELRFRLLNRRLAEMNGLPVEAHLGRTPSEVLPGLDALGAIEASWRQLLASGVPLLDVEIAGETPARPGQRRTWKESFYPIALDGRAIGLAAIVEETTDRRAADRFREHLVGIVGHDLRSPLQVIATTIELLTASALEPRAVASLRRMERAVERMVSIVDLLLDYSRITAAQSLPLALAPAELAVILDGVVADARARTRGRTIELEVEGDTRGVWDARRLGQVLQNLLDNALAYSPPAAPVRVVCRPEGAGLRIDLHNHGPVIPEDVVAALFEPMTRGEARSTTGLGLGLYIVDAIVRAHGGRIAVRSSDADGTCFSVELPREASAPA